MVHGVSRWDDRYTICQAKISKVGAKTLITTSNPQNITCDACKRGTE